MESKFNFEKAVEELLSGKKLTSKDRIPTPMIKELVETTLEAEIGSHLQSIKTNRRNGYNRKSNKGSSGKFVRCTSRQKWRLCASDSKETSDEFK